MILSTRWEELSSQDVLNIQCLLRSRDKSSRLFVILCELLAQCLRVFSRPLSEVGSLTLIPTVQVRRLRRSLVPVAPQLESDKTGLESCL